jgi:ABC-type enterobactin transport system permease subunit
MAATLVAVTLLIAAKVWHYWLSIALLAPIVLGIAAMAGLYVVTVLSKKHPRQ